MAKRIPVNDRSLPFKLTAQSAGVQKAYSAMVNQYGLTEGRRIFLAQASEKGTGRTLRQKADSIYTTGRTVPKGA
jgi:hypothetical protein